VDILWRHHHEAKKLIGNPPKQFEDDIVYLRIIPPKQFEDDIVYLRIMGQNQMILKCLRYLSNSSVNRHVKAPDLSVLASTQEHH
jgi:hypothetical protein